MAPIRAVKRWQATEEFAQLTATDLSCSICSEAQQRDLGFESLAAHCSADPNEPTSARDDDFLLVHDDEVPYIFTSATNAKNPAKRLRADSAKVRTPG